tara:strand:+ start:48513 stop:49331 length:819 start_codon:yes stop_codon:yes gene_type:complete
MNYESLKNKKLFYVFIILVVLLIFYGILFKYLGVDVTNDKIKLLQLFLFGIFIFLILINALNYFFDFDVSHGKNRTDVKMIEKDDVEDDNQVMGNNYNMLELTKNAKRDKDLSKSRASGSKEVFHIGDNVYTYDEAKILCNAYDGELADYQQIENAYKSGAEWCSYGWSKGQMALFPTQKLTFDKLQKISGLENSCGRTGINGGYIKNPKVRFGVNCYGVKGKPSTKERQDMLNNRHIRLPKTENNKKLDFYKRNINKVVKKPFNKNKWSFY